MIRTLASQVKQYRLPSLLTPIFMVGEVIFEMLIPLLMATIIDEGVEKNNMSVITRTGGEMLILAVCGLICGMMGAYLGSRASAGFARNLRQAMFFNIQDFSFSNIDKYSTASLVTRLTTDVTNVQNAYMMLLRMAVRAPISMIVAMFMAFMINASLARIYLVAVILLGVCLIFIMSTATKYFSRMFPQYDKLNETIDEDVTGIRVVKAYVREDYQTEKEKKASRLIYRLSVKAENMVVLSSPLMQATVYTCILLISWLGAKMIVQSQLTTGELMSLLTYCMNILMSLMMLSMVFVMITMSKASGDRIAEVLNEKPDLTNPENPDTEIPDGSIEYRDVSFSYRKGSGEPVLQDINLKIHSGETVGIIGSTGSAKTSLVSLLSRLYDVDSGAVLVGGKDVRTYDLVTLRDQVAVVLQKNVLFSGTILDNLRWGDKDATLEECREACRIAGADEFIDQMPQGYDTHIEQGGSNVSGGQKQRLCIARALLKKPKILILDDSTSAVDTATDARIRRAFREELPEMTKLIIAQRISSVQDADRVIVMDEGRVSGFDTPENLLRTNKIYREVYESQVGAGGDFDEGGDQ